MAIYMNVRKKLYTLGAVFAVIAGPAAGTPARQSAIASPANSTSEQSKEQPAFSRHSLGKTQDAKQDSTDRKFFVGSTLLVLGNFIPNDPHRPDFIQLNVGYRITPKNVVFLEFKRSKFDWPLGIPLVELFDEPLDTYPGYVRQNVIGLAYNRFWWKGFYTAVHAMSAFQKYMDEDNKEIANGYTLFMTYRLGYQFQFFKNRFFIEPSVGLTHWPVKTNTPESFKVTERRWPNYFGWEPGLHFGYNFSL